MTSLSSSSAPAPATEQPASDPALVDPDSLSEGRHRISAGAGTSDNGQLIMQITDAADLNQQPAAASKSPEVTTNGSAVGMNGHQQRSNGASVDDLSSKEKSKSRKEPDSAAKKNAPAKKEKNRISPSDQKEKRTADAQSPVSDGKSRAEDLPDPRSRKTHDSGGSVGGLSVDSGTDVMSPASSDSKSSDRSVDSPGAVFKSDASQGSPCHWGTSDSHSEVNISIWIYSDSY